MFRTLIAVIVFFMTIVSSQAQDTAPQFVEGDLMVIQYSANWCNPCMVLKNLIKTDSDLKALIKSDSKGYFFIDIDNPKNDSERRWLLRTPRESIPLVIQYRRFQDKWVEVKRFTGFRGKLFMMKWLKKPEITTWI